MKKHASHQQRIRLVRMLSVAGCLFVLASVNLSLGADLAYQAKIRKLDIDSFEHVWRTIRDKHWDPNLGGLNWQAIHDELRRKVDEADSATKARAAIREMISRLGLSHFQIISSDVYEDFEASPATRERDPTAGPPEARHFGDGITGIDVRVIGAQVLVTKVDPGSPAADAGVRPGWLIVKIRGKELAPLVRRVSNAYSKSTLRDFQLRRAVLARTAGITGERVPVEFLNERDQPVQVELRLAAPKGNPVRFGHLPVSYVWIEHRKLDTDIGYVTFNFFMDPARLMPEFERAIQSFEKCAGIIIDLRGNPGGIGAMSMGIAGWFISKPDQQLGTMYTRQTPLKFVVTPRLHTYHGPLAILVDGCSVSTSEIFAGGLKDLGRASVFGRRTAGAALPSIFEKLPNGDGFQYAIANYVSEGGKPLEGIGVVPDVDVGLTRSALLAGRDPVLDAAIEWIRGK